MSAHRCGHCGQTSCDPVACPNGRMVEQGRRNHIRRMARYGVPREWSEQSAPVKQAQPEHALDNDIDW